MDRAAVVEIQDPAHHEAKAPVAEAPVAEAPQKRVEQEQDAEEKKQQKQLANILGVWIAKTLPSILEENEEAGQVDNGTMEKKRAYKFINEKAKQAGLDNTYMALNPGLQHNDASSTGAVASSSSSAASSGVVASNASTAASNSRMAFSSSSTAAPMSHMGASSSMSSGNARVAQQLFSQQAILSDSEREMMLSESDGETTTHHARRPRKSTMI